MWCHETQEFSELYYSQVIQDFDSGSKYLLSVSLITCNQTFLQRKMIRVVTLHTSCFLHVWARGVGETVMTPAGHRLPGKSCSEGVEGVSA